MSTDDLINHRLGQYEIKSLLGRGGMATVYLARQTSMDRDVAIKVMARELAEDAQFVARFEHEAQLIARLQHPHILPVIDFGREDKYVFIAMQLVRGGSLDERLRKGGALSLDLASRMLTQIANALTFAHEQGIVHRDLKPNNVLLDERNNTYLTDFGIAKMLAGTTKLTATGNILGTPAYMAPEQWRGENVDARTDIYSFGIMAYEMVSGRLPFAGDTPYTLMYKHFNDMPPQLRQFSPNLSPAVEAVIMRTIAKLPDDRYQSADAMAEDFANAVRGIAPSAAPQLSGIDAATIVGDADFSQRATLPPTGDEMPTIPPTTPPPGRKPSAPSIPAAGTTAVTPAEPRRMNPILIGAGVLIVLAVVAGIIIALLSGGKDDDKKSSPTAIAQVTETLATAAQRIGQAVIVSERASVRSGPGQEHPVIGTLERDEDIVINAMTDDGLWYQVVYETQLGWISAESIRISNTPNLPQITYTPTQSPTEMPTEEAPTETPTIEITNTPEAPTETPTLEITNTPEAPSETPAPDVSPTPQPASADLFVPQDFTPTAINQIGIVLDYPGNWNAPIYDPIQHAAEMHPEAEADPARYPTIRIGRGTPDQLTTAGFMRNSSSAVTAIESTTGLPAGGHVIQRGTNIQTFKIDRPGLEVHGWAWLVMVSDTDWVFVVAQAPAGEFEASFEEQVLTRMVTSIQIDGNPLFTQIDTNLFIPTSFKRTALGNINVSVDYPFNWVAPVDQGAGIYFLHAFAEENQNYPRVWVLRVAPQDLLSADITTDISSPQAAIEHTLGNDDMGRSEAITTFAYPTYKVDSSEGLFHRWYWLIEVSETDWVCVIALAPTGTYDQSFADQALNRMVTSLRIDNQDLLASQSSTGATTLTDTPLQGGETVMDRFDDAIQDWQYGSIRDGQLALDLQDASYLYWTYPGTGAQAEDAFYTQITSELVQPPASYEIGLAFRMDADAGSFYYFLINHAQEFALYSVNNNEFTELIPYTSSGLIQVGQGARNTLGVLVIGDYIELYLNDSFVGSAQSHDHPLGDIRATAYTFGEAGTVAFDDFAYMPVTLSEGTVVNISVALAQSPTAINLLSTPGGDLLQTIAPNNLVAVIGHSEDNGYFYGYAQGALGWFSSGGVQLTRAGAISDISARPALPDSVPGVDVTLWPVIWPENASTAETIATDSGTTLATTSATLTPAPGETINYGDTVQTSIETFGTMTWTFEGNAADVVTISATANTDGLDLFVTLRGPDDIPQYTDDDSGGDLNPLISNFMLASSGTYTIELLSIGGSGDYTLSLAQN